MLGFTQNTAPRVLALSVLSCGLLSAASYLAELLKDSEQAETARAILLNPGAPELNRTAPDVSRVRLDTSQGSIVIELRREWSPHGVDRFYSLVQAGYYDDSRFFRVIADRWAQFGINGDPAVAQAWRTQTIPDDPRRVSNIRGTVAFAFAVPNGRATQVFINLRDNSKAHDAEPFVPIGRVTEGMDVADRLYSGYGETSGGGIRAGKQGALFRDGNAYLQENFPRLDFIRKGIALQPGAER
jgi:peptidyl-prolyl cis-trans isomerase A (cyclophilin A)